MIKGGLTFGAHGGLCEKDKILVTREGFEILLTVCRLAKIFDLVCIFVVRGRGAVIIDPLCPGWGRDSHRDKNS